MVADGRHQNDRRHIGWQVFEDELHKAGNAVSKQIIGCALACFCHEGISHFPRHRGTYNIMKPDNVPLVHHDSGRVRKPGCEVGAGEF